MVDIHSHILFDIDDGARTIKDALKIIKQENNVGIDAIFLTSHYFESANNSYKENYLNKFNALSSELKRKNINVKLYVGNEIMIYPDLPEDIDNNKFYTLNNSKYILIEIPLVEDIMYFEDVIDKIIKKGFIPIIAHPERCKYFRKHFSDCKKFIKSGVLFQINAGSLVGNYGRYAKYFAYLLLRYKMVHFIAFDSHSQESVVNNFNKLICKLRFFFGKKYVEAITSGNAFKIINDEKI